MDKKAKQNDDDRILEIQRIRDKEENKRRLYTVLQTSKKLVLSASISLWKSLWKSAFHRLLSLVCCVSS
jgi:hypothetical protein